MSKVRIVSDGTTAGTKVFCVDDDGSEREIAGVVAVNVNAWSRDALVRATIEVIEPIVDIVAERPTP